MRSPSGRVQRAWLADRSLPPASRRSRLRSKPLPVLSLAAWLDGEDGVPRPIEGLGSLLAGVALRVASLPADTYSRCHNPAACASSRGRIGQCSGRNRHRRHHRRACRGGACVCDAAASSYAEDRWRPGSPWRSTRTGSRAFVGRAFLRSGSFDRRLTARWIGAALPGRCIAAEADRTSACRFRDAFMAFHRRACGRGLRWAEARELSPKKLRGQPAAHGPPQSEQRFER